MPKFFCDYCDVYLTHDSMSVRKAHNTGRNHLRNVVDYYQQIGHDKAQSVIDSITSSYAAEGQSGSNPMLQGHGPMGGMGMGGPPMGFGGGFPPPGMPPGFAPPHGMPPMGFGRGMPPGFPPPPQGFPPGFAPPAGMPPFPPPTPGHAGSPPAGMQFPPPNMPFPPPNMPGFPPGAGMGGPPPPGQGQGGFGGH